jgi:hypothetical protein
MALRDISNKAQMSLASLYQEAGSETDDLPSLSQTQKKLFDDENDDVTD